ncbi:hypothetical protein KFK09_006965 [Dendrobium nobile]|uniref:Uncharacterized protein n=1 Tax=Dendrobium nobile TaxID=94219 RepID=A0A8T3BTV7_DENNO|nr:hypothetical protein KFK09_006965 [Dendrobium nobile]
MARTHSCVRRRSKDKLSMSKHLMEEAEKHIDEFLSNIEDADISSFDGDRSDTSSTIGGNSKCRDPVTYNTIEEIHENLVSPAASPVDSEGILLPWLHLETSNEGSSCPCKNNSSLTMNTESSFISVESEDFTREQLNDNPHGDRSYFAASRDIRGITCGKFESASEQSTGSPCNSSFFMDELNYQSFNEDIVNERYLHRQRIESGSLLICGRSVL